MAATTRLHHAAQRQSNLLLSQWGLCSTAENCSATETTLGKQNGLLCSWTASETQPCGPGTLKDGMSFGNMRSRDLQKVSAWWLMGGGMEKKGCKAQWMGSRHMVCGIWGVCGERAYVVLEEEAWEAQHRWVLACTRLPRPSPSPVVSSALLNNLCSDQMAASQRTGVEVVKWYEWSYSHFA